MTTQGNKLTRTGLTLTMAVTLLCGLAGLSSNAKAQTQTDAPDATTDHAGWVQIPGELIRPECVHEIPNGATVEATNDGQITGDVTKNGELIAHFDACSEDAFVTRPRGRTGKLNTPPGTGNGWVEASLWDVPLGSSDNLDFMGGNWTVPSNPSVNGALIYLFNGMEPSSENWILQPVLQYGSGAAGGGNYWVIASWLVGKNYAFHSPLETVHPGNSMLGYTKLTSVSGNTLYWEVVAQDTTTGANSWITAHTSGLHWTWAYAGVLEAYNVNSCSNFPANGRAVFTNATIAHGFPSYKVISGQGWVGDIYSYGGPSCRFMIVAGTESTLDF
jgi:hypothetical protein